MTNAYCNMSVPPQTRVRKVVRPVGRYVIFSIHTVNFKPPFGSPKDFPSPQDWIDDFLAQHREVLESVPRPSGYMVGYNGLMQDSHLFCADPILTVAILGRVSGGVYIPRRRIAFGDGLAGTKVYSFPERYFPEENLPLFQEVGCRRAEDFLPSVEERS